MPCKCETIKKQLQIQDKIIQQMERAIKQMLLGDIHAYNLMRVLYNSLKNSERRWKMIEGFKICLNWRTRKELPDLPNDQILDKVADTVVEMTIENGKMARTLHEVMIRIFKKSELPPEDVSYLRDVIIRNLGREYADPFTEEKHED